MKYLIAFALCAILARQINGAVLGVTSEEAKTIADALIVPEEPINEDCHQPRETGRCFALFYRYAYNVDSRICEEFIYGGCEGNKNNFETKEECEAKCLKYFERSSEVTEGSAKVKEASKEIQD